VRSRTACASCVLNYGAFPLSLSHPPSLIPSVPPSLLPSLPLSFLLLPSHTGATPVTIGQTQTSSLTWSTFCSACLSIERCVRKGRREGGREGGKEGVWGGRWRDESGCFCVLYRLLREGRRAENELKGVSLSPSLPPSLPPFRYQPTSSSRN